MGENTPSENEWMVMEIIWSSNRDMTAAEIIEALHGKVEISAKTIRVMINRLVGKGVLTFTVDTEDARIYHYHAAKSKKECIGVKSRKFVKNYFGGNTSLAIANFLQSADITKEQLDELKTLVDRLEKEQ